jgi:hypothetical protein
MKNNKVNGFVGLLISVGIAFVGVVNKENVSLALLTPLGILVAFFFAGFMFRGNWKDGIRWLIIMLIISLVIFGVAYLLK